LEIFNMKKTLVALAAVAATGGAFAQATLTGDFSYGYSQETTGAGVATGGMGIGDADLYWQAKEAIDGVGSLTVDLTLDLSGGAAVSQAGESMTLKLTNGVSILMGNVKGAAYLAGGIASAGSAFDTALDGKTHGSRSFKDTVSVSIPVSEAVKLGFSTEEGGSSAKGSGAAGTTLYGAQRRNTVSVSYAAGALAASAGYRSFDGTSSLSSSYASSMNRASASYDLGMAKIGGGYEATTYGYGNTLTETLGGITIPLGNLTIGAQAGTAQTSGLATNTSRSGAVYGGSYSLSKRTSLTGQYYSYDAGLSAGNTTGYTFKMFTTF